MRMNFCSVLFCNQFVYPNKFVLAILVGHKITELFVLRSNQVFGQFIFKCFFHKTFLGASLYAGNIRQKFRVSTYYIELVMIFITSCFLAYYLFLHYEQWLLVVFSLLGNFLWEL